MSLTCSRKLLIGFGIMVALLGGLDGRAPLAAGRLSTPVITGVLPATPKPAADPQLLTVNGRDFLPRLELTVTTPEGGTMRFKGATIMTPRETSFQVLVPLGTPGRYSLVVLNADGGASAAYLLDVGVEATTPTPVIERILPDQIARNTEPQELKVQGQRFAPGLRGVVTNPDGTELGGLVIRDLTAASFTLGVRLETTGTYTLVVSNPGSTPSNVMTFVVR